MIENENERLTVKCLKSSTRTTESLSCDIVHATITETIVKTMTYISTVLKRHELNFGM